MKILYEISIRMIYLLLKPAGWLFPSWRKWREVRKIQSHQIANKLLPFQKSTIWIHCASSGEYQQIRVLLKLIKKENSAEHLTLSFFSHSGMDSFKDHELIDNLLYSPLDTKKSIQEFINYIHPKLVIYVQNEFWPNQLWMLIQSSIPFIYLNSNFNKQNFWTSGVLGLKTFKTLEFAEKIFVINKESLLKLQTIGQFQVEVTGDLRIDQVLHIKSKGLTIPGIKEFTGNKSAIIFSSIHKEDEKIFLKVLPHLKNDKVIIVPHDIDVSYIKRLQIAIQEESILYSKLATKDFSKTNILILDKVGLLPFLYQYGKSCYIGGGFGKGIHNILEPAVHACPMCFGVNYLKSPEAVDFIHAGAANVVSDHTEFLSFLKQVSFQREFDKRSVFFSNYMSEHKGASQKVFEYLHSKRYV